MMPTSITSAQQQGIMSLRRDPSQDQASILDITPTIAAMVGLGNVAADGSASREAQAVVSQQPQSTTTTTYIDPTSGEQRHDITLKGVPSRTLAPSDPQQQVQAAYDAPQTSVAQSINDLMHSLGRKVVGEGLPQDTSTWRGRYGLEREQGASPIAAAAKAAVTGIPILQPGLERNVNASRFGTEMAVARQVMPILQEQHRQDTENRLFAKDASRVSNEQRTAQDQAFGRIIASGQANVLGATPEDAAAAADLMVPGGLRPDQKAQFPLIYQKSVQAAEKVRALNASKTINEISPNAIQADEDPKAYVAGLPGADQFTPQETSLALSRAAASQRTLARMDQKDRMQLSLQAEQLQRQRDANTLQSRAIAMQDPKLMDALTDKIAADPQLYTSLQANNDKGQKEALQTALIGKFGRVPNPLSKSDLDRLSAVNVGGKDLNVIDQETSKWAGLGHPLNGALVGRARLGAGGLGSADLASAGVPIRWTGPDGQVHTRNEYLQALQNVRVATTNLTTREIRSLTGGASAFRSTTLFDYLKQASPQLFQDGPILAGSTAGVRREFANTKQSILEQAWGGIPPASAAKSGASGDMKSLSNDDLFKILLNPKGAH